MCQYCHTLYDRGLIGVNNSVLEKSDKLNLTNYDLVIEEKKIIKAFNDINFEFFDYHYSKIYNK
jgi:response regulator RpfG family c-di-GMP phosphodiesterase